MASNNDKIECFDDSDFMLDGIELMESLLSEIPEFVSSSQDGCDHADEDVDPIPFHEIAPEDGYQALVPYSTPLDFWFASNCAPVQVVSLNQEPAPKTTTPSKKKRSPSSTTTKRQKPGARSAKKTVTKRKLTPTKIQNCIDVPHFCPENDVLFGRGGHANHNPGNGYLLDAVKAHRSEYKGLDKTKEGKEKKKIIIQRVAEMVQARGGRFLVREHNSWQEASGEQVHKKLGHMLRDK